MVGSVALVVAVFTSNMLLPSVRSHVLFYSTGLNARKVALVTLKGLLSRMSEHVGLEVGSL